MGLTSLNRRTTGKLGPIGRKRPLVASARWSPGGGRWPATSWTGDEDSTAGNSDEKILHVTLGD